MANPRSLLMKSGATYPRPGGEMLKQYFRLEIPAASGIGQVRWERPRPDAPAVDG